MASRGTDAATDLYALPGHYVRRLQQIAVALFFEETEGFNVTPVQYAALVAVQRQPRMDQRTLARAIAFDTSTIGGVVDRLEARGLMQRNTSPDDRRVRLLTITQEGETLLREIHAAILRVQQRLVEPLPPPERERFVQMLKTLVEANNELSRAPREV